MSLLFLGPLLACNPAGSALDEAERMAGQGNDVAALAEFARVTETWPESPEAAEARTRIPQILLARVDEQEARGDHDQALDGLQDLVRAWPGSAEAGQASARVPANRLGYAQALADRGESSRALAAVDELRDGWPTSHESGKPADELVADITCAGGEWGAYMSGRFVGDGGDTEEECNATVQRIFRLGSSMGMSSGSGPPPCTCKR